MLLPSCFHRSLLSLFKSFASGGSRYKRTMGFAFKRCWVSDPKPWGPMRHVGTERTRAPAVSPQFTGSFSLFFFPFFSLSLSSVPFYTATLGVSLVNSPLYCILTAGDTVPCEILPAVSRLAKRRCLLAFLLYLAPLCLTLIFFFCHLLCSLVRSNTLRL